LQCTNRIRKFELECFHLLYHRFQFVKIFRICRGFERSGLEGEYLENAFLDRKEKFLALLSSTKAAASDLSFSCDNK